MNKHQRATIKRNFRKTTSTILIALLLFLSPATSLAQAVDATGEPTGAPACTGAGCGQGANQGANQGTQQGVNQGGQSAADLGAQTDANGNTVLPAGVTDTRQGAAQGTTNGITATNSGTGANSDNANAVDANSSTTTGITNTATDTTATAGTATSGGNAANKNTGTGGITSGNASIGVTQVKNDNTATVGGSAGLTTTGYNGNHQGDLVIGFGAGTANLSGDNGGSVRAINETTGSDSSNSNDISTRTEEITEVQNDGTINNLLDLAAITGQNEANKNTGDGKITTGDANVGATLINLLNTTVVNGDIWITVADIFGNLEGDIVVSDLASLGAAARAQQTNIDATNDGTGSNSNNTIDIDVTDTETTRINNEADINTTINADAITGQNTAEANTGGSEIASGDASVVGSNVSIANTTVEGGNWGLFIVNALNGWFGYLVGDSGEVKALSQEETIREIEARNDHTGENSDNTIAIADETNRTTTVDNDATINNEINARAITGQNEASKNTGQGDIESGDANVQATAVNIANTTVKDGSLFIAVVNIFGDWLGDLFYDGKSLAQAAAAQSAGHQVDINAGNSDTGSESNNEVNVDINRTHETTITNDADLNFALNANVDTGGNRANRNTQGANIKTGEGYLAQHSRAAANLTAIAGSGGLSVEIDGENESTGFDSTNRLRANINDTRLIDVNNAANISTLLGSLRSPALVNTGNNEANQNTLGARIITGNANADVVIQNLVNKVIIALAGEGVEVDADFVNRLTGALSENGNELNVVRDVLVTVFNDALIDNILNLLLNTGGNTANENTGGSLVQAGDTSITTGSICVDTDIRNNANSVSVTGATDQTVTNNGQVNNVQNIQGTTGNNELRRNTVGGTAASSDGCAEKLAAAPTPTPTPGPAVGGPTGNGGGGDNGGDDEHHEDKPRVAGVTTSPKINGGKHSILKRFPVAGGESLAQLLQGDRASGLWMYLLVAAAILAGSAWNFDRRAQLTLPANSYWR